MALRHVAAPHRRGMECQYAWRSRLPGTAGSPELREFRFPAGRLRRRCAPGLRASRSPCTYERYRWPRGKPSFLALQEREQAICNAEPAFATPFGVGNLPTLGQVAL